MSTNRLIRTIGGVEMPARGPWLIGGGHPVSMGCSGGWRRRRSNGRTISGSLVIGETPTDSTIALRAQRLDNDRGPATIDIDGQLVTAEANGRWLFVGTAASDDKRRPALIRVTYRGVYRNRDRATVWLSLHASVNDSATPQGLIRRRPTLTINTDLNATAPRRTAA